MKPNYYFVYGIIICIYLIFSGYMNCASFETRDCSFLGIDTNCKDSGRRSHPSNGSYRNAPTGFGSGNNFWFHK